MYKSIANHFRLNWRLLKDGRVSYWLKGLLFFVPLVYALAPFVIDIPDFLPVVGLLDDAILLGISTVLLNACSPSVVVQEHKLSMQGLPDERGINLEQERHPDELRSLGIGLAVTMLSLLISGSAVGIAWMAVFVAGYVITSFGRASLLANAVVCSPVQFPDLYSRLQEAQAALPPVKVNMFVTQDPRMSAYTYGYNEPFTIVITSGLVEKLNGEELRAVIGHELGHILFDHVLLINLMSRSVSGIETLLFTKWSRSSEYSADAIALRASGYDPKPMITALLKLASGLSTYSYNLDIFLEQVTTGDTADLAGKVEMVSTHPFINNRIRRLIELTAARGRQSQPGMQITLACQ